MQKSKKGPNSAMSSPMEKYGSAVLCTFHILNFKILSLNVLVVCNA